MAVLSKGILLGDDSRYKVVRKLGEGAFAEVWEVRDQHVGGENHRVRGRWEGGLTTAPAAVA